MSAYWDRVDRQADALAAAWDALVEGDNVTVTLPVTVKVIGFGRRHVWVETEDLHRFAIRRESAVVITTNRTEQQQ